MVPYVEGVNEFLIYYYIKPPKDGKYEKGSYFSVQDIKRNDENLVKVVEQLGKKANGRCANLKIVEIPDGIDYEIENYDGMEHIAETHRIWD